MTHRLVVPSTFLPVLRAEHTTAILLFSSDALLRISLVAANQLAERLTSQYPLRYLVATSRHWSRRTSGQSILPPPYSLSPLSALTHGRLQPHHWEHPHLPKPTDSSSKNCMYSLLWCLVLRSGSPRQPGVLVEIWPIIAVSQL